MKAPRVGVGVLVWKGTQVLLVRRKGVHGHGTWSTPGGHLDPGESLEACAAREALEETGVELTAVRFRAVTNDVFSAEGLHYITVWMEGEWKAGEPAPLAEYELSRVGWFTPDSLPDHLFPPLVNLVAGRCYSEGRGGLLDGVGLEANPTSEDSSGE